MTAAASPFTGSAWSRSNPCVICGGHPSLPQGKGVRCYGFASSDGRYAHCTREEHAGSLSPHKGGSTFAHRIEGGCRCGFTHGSSAPVASIRSSRTARHDDRPLPWAVPEAHVEMIHEYRLGGALLWQLCRFWPQYRAQYGGAKGKPRHIGAGGCWYLGQGHWKGREKPLYRQDEAVNELRLGGKVFVVEGERDADAVREVGSTAVCNPDGAGSFREHQARTLVEAMREGEPSAELCIIADADPKGLEHAKRTRRLLLDIDSSLKHRIEVVLPPFGAKDVSEFLSRGGASHE